MEAVLVTNTKSKEEFNVENAEIAGNLSNGSISEAVEKVLIWFAKNEERNSVVDCLEKISLKSSYGSNVNYDLKTPSILSGSADSHGYLK